MDQKLATSTIWHMKGENALDINIINTKSFFGSEDIRPHVDVTIILGNFTIDTNIHPKLLLLHFSGMLANVNYSDERRNQIARDMYHHLWPISGRQGMR